MSFSRIRLLICEAAWFSSIITILKLNTVREIIPLTMADMMLLAVLASFNDSQCAFDFIAFPDSEKSN